MKTPGERAFEQSLQQYSQSELSESKNEAKIVGELMRRIKMPSKVRNAVYDLAKSYGRSVTINDVEQFVQFPYYVKVAKPSNLRDKVKCGKLFDIKYMLKLPVVRQFFEDKEELPPGSPHAMFIQWPYTGLAVMHDLTPTKIGATTRLLYSLPVRDSDGDPTDASRLFYIENFASFMDMAQDYGEIIIAGA